MTLAQLPCWQINAFVGDGLQGNPAAVIECPNWLGEEAMQSIARETGGTATAFLVPDDRGRADWQIRWFGNRKELTLCGHATMASAHIMLQRNKSETATFLTQQGRILEAKLSDAGVELNFSAIETEPTLWPEAASLIGGEPIEVYRSPKGYAAFFFANEEEICGLKPDYAGLAGLGDDQFICTASGRKSDVISRVFVPGSGLNEDIATGSAHAVLAPLWADRLGRSQFSAIQASQRGGHMVCRLEGDRVALTGQCVTIIEGQYHLSG